MLHKPIALQDILALRNDDRMHFELPAYLHCETNSLNQAPRTCRALVARSFMETGLERISTSSGNC